MDVLMVYFWIIFLVLVRLLIRLFNSILLDVHQTELLALHVFQILVLLILQRILQETEIYYFLIHELFGLFWV